MKKHPLDPAEYVDRMALLLELPLDPAYRPGVIDNMTRLIPLAQLVMEFSLPENIDISSDFLP